MKSQHEFSQVPRADIPRSSFNLSHSHKTTFDADFLYPICAPIDIIPGDTFSWNTSFFIRLNTMLRPVLDNMRFETFAFFIPTRTVWQNHEKFHGAQDDPGDSIDYTVPVITGTSGGTGENTLWDYFGLPLGPSGSHLDPDTNAISAIPFRCYSKIWNEWFRDENLQDSMNVALGNGPDELAVDPNATQV